MKFLTFDIEAKGHIAKLRCYIPDAIECAKYKDNRPAVIIFPGGGYAFTYEGEAEPIALKYISEGICAFVLDYACAPVRFPVPQLQAFKAIRFVREHAKEWGIDENNIITTGFSAGGHLCSTTGTLWNKFSKYFKEEKMDDCDIKTYRPNKIILCYPVILSSKYEFSHVGSSNNLLGENPSDELLELISTDKQVDKFTPPTFIWHTSADDGVSPINSYEFALSLSKNHIPCETHVYLKGGHGLCLGNSVTSEVEFNDKHQTSEWIDKAIAFCYEKID